VVVHLEQTFVLAEAVEQTVAVVVVVGLVVLLVVAVAEEGVGVEVV